MRKLILLLIFALSACASAPTHYLALEKPYGVEQIQVNQDTNLCNEIAAGSQAIAVDCMQRRGYKLVTRTIP